MPQLTCFCIKTGHQLEELFIHIQHLPHHGRRLARAIPAFGTTHADHFYGDVPGTRKLIPLEIEKDYELNTGKVIIETLEKSDHMAVPSVLVANHGPFSWGKDVADAVYNAIALEEIAFMAYNTVLLGRSIPVSKPLIDKHFNRKHGNDAYYGQSKK